MAKTTTDLTKAITANGYVNGAAYINPNSLKIPSTVQKLTPPSGISTPVSQSENLAWASGLVMDRFNDYDYYTA